MESTHDILDSKNVVSCVPNQRLCLTSFALSERDQITLFLVIIIISSVFVRLFVQIHLNMCSVLRLVRCGLTLWFFVDYSNKICGLVFRFYLYISVWSDDSFELYVEFFWNWMFILHYNLNRNKIKMRLNRSTLCMIIMNPWCVEEINRNYFFVISK